MTQDWIRLDDRRLWIYGAFFLSAVVLTLYSVSLGHAFLFDEENIILKNPYLKDPGRWKELWSQGFFYMPDRPTVLWTQYFRPLTSLSFALNFLVSKADPFLYHVTNAFLHGVVCVLLFRWVWRVTGHGLASLLAALFFAVHPVQTEAVSYLASRSDLLAAFAVLTTFHLYRGKKYLAGVVVFAMGLFMKESVILLPVALFLFDGLLLKADTQTRAKRLVPFFVVAATYLVYRKYFCAVPLGPPVLDWREAALRVMSMGDALEGYARAIVWPKPFQFGKEIHFAQNLSNPIVWKSAFLALALAALAVALRKTKGPLLGLALTFLFLAPTLQWIPFYPEWAEHYLYLPLVGLTVLMASGLAKILEGRGRPLKIFLILVFSSYLAALSVRAWERNKIYNEAESFYSALSGSESPYAFYGYQNLARLAIEEGRLDKAVAPLQQALFLAPHSDSAWALVGRFELEKRSFERARDAFSAALALDPNNNEYRVNLANAAIGLGDYEDAQRILEETQRRNPRYYAVYVNLILLQDLAGNPEAAVRYGEAGLVNLKENKSQQAMILLQLARLAYRQGWDEEALGYARQVARDYGQIPWHGSVAKLLTGDIDERTFLQSVSFAQGGLMESAKNYLLMASVLKKDKDKIREFLKENEAWLTRSSEHKTLFQKEILRAKNALGADPS